MENTPPIFGFVVPCYNEEECILETVKVLSEKISFLVSKNIVDKKSFCFFIDDGSKDKTWSLLRECASKNKFVKAIKLSSNIGHQKALFAGLNEIKKNVDCCVSIDADLQDDVDCVDKMLQWYGEGYEVVLGVRKKRKSDSILKRSTASFFYKLMKMLNIKTVENHADFRLLGKKSLEALTNHQEKNLFLRGMVIRMGFKTKEVYYDRKKRIAGVTKYPFKKMVSLAWEGISSFSAFPMRLLAFIGIITMCVSFGVTLWALITFFSGRVVPGWTSTVVPIYFLGGVQMLGLGLLGEYIGKIYIEVKNRPHYFVEEEL